MIFKKCLTFSKNFCWFFLDPLFLQFFEKLKFFRGLEQKILGTFGDFLKKWFWGLLSFSKFSNFGDFLGTFKFWDPKKIRVCKKQKKWGSFRPFINIRKWDKNHGEFIPPNLLFLKSSEQEMPFLGEQIPRYIKQKIK